MGDGAKTLGKVYGFGMFWLLGAILEYLGDLISSYGILEPFWGHLGAILGPSWDHVGAMLGPC